MDNGNQYADSAFKFEDFVASAIGAVHSNMGKTRYWDAPFGVRYTLTKSVLFDAVTSKHIAYFTFQEHHYNPDTNRRIKTITHIDSEDAAMTVAKLVRLDSEYKEAQSIARFNAKLAALHALAELPEDYGQW